MDRATFFQYKCDVCGRSEVVVEKGKPVVKFRQVRLDYGNQEPAATDFQMCPYCVGRAFGEDYVGENDIAEGNVFLVNFEENILPQVDDGGDALPEDHLEQGQT